eukprot:12504826-Ditylum_brightwellii.AAC.1
MAVPSCCTDGPSVPPPLLPVATCHLWQLWWPLCCPPGCYGILPPTGPCAVPTSAWRVRKHLPTEQLGALYLLCARLTILFHLLCQVALSVTPP